MKKFLSPILCAVCMSVLLLPSCAQEPAISTPSELQFLKGTDKPIPLDNNSDITDDDRNFINKANIVLGNKSIEYKNVKY